MIVNDNTWRLSVLVFPLLAFFAGCGSNAVNPPSEITQDVQQAIELEDALIDAAESANDN
jgi:hypothetical protein